MYKSVILLITLLTVGITYIVSESSKSQDLNLEIFRLQTGFLYFSEILFGLLLSGILCIGKNKFEPFHIAQIFVSGVYMLCELALQALIFTEISYNGILCINALLSFFVIVIIILLMLANFYSNSNVQKVGKRNFEKGNK